MKTKTKTKKEPAFVKQTLAWCNQLRKEQGKSPLKKMPKGRRTDPKSCPCGKASGASVETHLFHKIHKDFGVNYRNSYSLPAAVRKFVAAFDHGDLPQYDADWIAEGLAFH